MYGINKGVDRVFVKPFAYIYQGAVPKPFRLMVGNFFQNLRTIPTIVNDLLQGNGKCFCDDTARLIINTTLGVGGLFDIAAYAGLERRYVDFGLTLGKWGYRESIYIVLPFFGPSTIRDSIGMGVTYYMSVWPYIPKIKIHHHKAIGLRNGLFIVDAIDTRARLFETEALIETAAVDEYTFVRDAYLQNRLFEIDGCGSAPPIGPTSVPVDVLQGPPE